MIPKQLHIIWINEGKPPAEVAEAIESWREHAAELMLRVWDREAVTQQYGDAILAVHTRLQHVANHLRGRILYDHGGVYVDADMYAQAGVGTLLSEICEHTMLIGVSSPSHGTWENSLIGCSPELPGFEMVANQPVESYGGWNQFLLATAMPVTRLNGLWWNSQSIRPGVMIEHRRASLRLLDPGLEPQPELPPAVIRSEADLAAYKAAYEASRVAKESMQQK